MDIKRAVQQVLLGNDLKIDEMRKVMTQIMSGKATDAQIGGFLVGLRIKGETTDEIIGAAQIMRELSLTLKIDNQNLVDRVGTGGDEASIFNVSTASIFVAAAAGANVAKHGNRGVSSNSGSADLLEAAGININLSEQQIISCVKETGVGFMFAVNHHAAMKYAVSPRRELGVRTIFNLLGPLTNPANVRNMVLGVYDKKWLRPLAEVMKKLGGKNVLVVHSEDGLDEISISANTLVAELKNNKITEYSVSPEDFGMRKGILNDLKVKDPEESFKLIKSALTKQAVLSAKVEAASDMIAMNAGAALYVSGIAKDLKEGVILAQDSIGSGLAKEKFSELASFTNCFN
jgi:anthranilate phosphoribosyltransferase